MRPLCRVRCPITSIWIGSGLPTPESVEAVSGQVHGRPWSLALTLPPLSALFFKPDPLPEPEPAAPPEAGAAAEAEETPGAAEPPEDPDGSG